VAQGEASALTKLREADVLFGKSPFMTLTAIKKLAIKVPLAQRLKLADAMWESIPSMREPVTLEELERRADEVISGKVKAISGKEFDAELDRLEKSIFQRRSAHRS
jgi:putative addiction module component (TIGR02574 family)